MQVFTYVYLYFGILGSLYLLKGPIDWGDGFSVEEVDSITYIYGEREGIEKSIDIQTYLKGINHNERFIIGASYALGKKRHYLNDDQNLAKEGYFIIDKETMKAELDLTHKAFMQRLKDSSINNYTLRNNQSRPFYKSSL